MVDNTQRSKDILEFLIKSSCAIAQHSPNSHLSVREIKLLHYLEESKHKKITVGDLSQRMELTMPATSKLLKVLEQKEYIIRNADSKDRRTINVSITEKGSDTIRQGWAYFTKSIDSIVDYMGEEKADEFIVLSKLYLSALTKAGYLTEKEEAAC